MRTLVLKTVAAILIPASGAMADQLVLKNGDRLTGTVVKSDGKTLTLKSDLAGTVTVPMDAITGITTEQPVYLTLSDNQTLVGPVTTADGKLVVRTAETGTINVDRTAVQSVRSKEEQDAYQKELDRLRNPSLRDLWSGTVDAGLSLSRGNADTSTSNFGFNATRTTSRDKITAYMTTLYARNKTEGVSQVTANAKRGGVRYDLNISPKLFAFGLGSLEADEFQKLDLRVSLGGGMGWHAVKTDSTVLEVFGGGSLNKEYFTDLNRTSGEALIGEEYDRKLTSRVSIKERATFLPNLTETGQYRFNFDATGVTLLSTWLSWTISVSDRYLSNPISGTKANDLLLTSGFRLTFGAKQ